MLAPSYFARRYFPSSYFGGAGGAVVDLPAFTIALLTLDSVLTMPAPNLSQLTLNTDALVRLRGVKIFDPISGNRIPATGLTIQARLAETPGGAAIHGALQINLTERAAGDYHGTFQGSDIDSYCRAHLGERLFLVLAVGGSDYHGYLALPVVDGVSLGL